MPEKNDKRRIFVVDDDVDMRELVVTVCKDRGAEVFPLTDGEALLKVMKAKKHADLIILDLMMKTVNGLQALKEMRALDHFGAYTPTIVLTGYTDPRLAAAAAKFNIAGFVTKPFNEDDFWKLCTQAFQPDYSLEELKNIVKNLRVQDVKLFDDLADSLIHHQDYRIYPASIRGQGVVVLFKSPFTPQQCESASFLDIVNSVRIYRSSKKETRLLWPTLKVSTSLANTRT